MKALLSRQWFLLLVLLGVLLVWLQPSWVEWTRHLEPTVCGAVAVFLSAWGLESYRLLAALRRPWPALWALLISYGVLPALGWLAASQIPVEDFRIGLIVITCVPCTLASAAIWTRLAGGDEAISLLVTVLSNSTSWLATTGWLILATNVREISLAHAGGIMTRLLIVLVIPVAVGQMLRSVRPLAEFAVRRRRVLGIFARLLVLGIMIKAAVEVGGRLREEHADVTIFNLMLVVGSCVVLHLSALYLGFCTSAWIGFDRTARIAVAISGSQKTLPVSLILFNAYFTRFPLAVLPMVVFHVGQLVVDTFLAGRWRRSALETVPNSPAPLPHSTREMNEL